MDFCCRSDCLGRRSNKAAYACPACCRSPNLSSASCKRLDASLHGRDEITNSRASCSCAVSCVLPTYSR